MLTLVMKMVILCVSIHGSSSPKSSSQPDTTADWQGQPTSSQPGHSPLPELPGDDRRSTGYYQPGVIDRETGSGFLMTTDDTLVNSWLNDVQFLDQNFSVSEFMKTLCPNVISCQSPEVNEFGESCCLTCSCLEECVVNGNCCYDVDFASNSSRPLSITGSGESCLYAYLGKAGGDAQLARHGALSSYLLVDTCIEGASEESKTNCINPDQSNVSHLTPVYSPLTHLNYRNIYCMQCNNVRIKDISEWRPILGCVMIERVFMYLKSANVGEFIDKLLYVFGSCWIEWRPPSNHTETCLRNDAIVDYCIDNRIDEFPSEIPLVCSRGETIPFGTPSGPVYKNVFCYGCSNIHMPVYDLQCDPTGREKRTFFFEGTLDTNVVNLNKFFLSLNEDFPPMVMPDGACAGDFQFSQTLETCYKLVCAPSKYHNANRCVPLFRQVSGIAKLYKVDVFDTQGLLSTKYLEQLTVSAIFNVNHTESDLYIHDPMKVCLLASSQTEENVDGTRYYIHVISVAVPITKLTDIEAEFYALKERLSVSGLELISRIEKTPYISERLAAFAYIRYHGEFEAENCRYHIAMTDLQFCDAVLFPYSKNKLRQSLVDIKGVKFEPYEYIVRYQDDAVYIQICEETAIQKLAQFSFNPRGNDAHGVHVVALAVKVKVLILTIVLLSAFSD